MAKDEPTDQEILEFIWPILREGKLARDTLTVTGERAVYAVVERWPGMGIKRARQKVTRLRIL